MTKKKSRLLAAIMFTEIVGHTALMQADKQKPSRTGTGIEKYFRTRLQYSGTHSTIFSDERYPLFIQLYL
jgi:hypothetical protein